MTAHRTPRYVTYRDAEYIPALYKSVTQGNARAVESMLDGAADPNAVFANRTMLQMAAEQGDVSIVKLLLSFGADPNMRARPDNFTPLMQAALETSDVHMFATLVAAGARLDDTTHGGMTALMVAAEHSNLEAVRFLITAGADLYVRTPRGKTAYDIAVNNGHSECAAQLFEVMSRKGLYRAKTLGPLSVKPAPRPK